MYLLCMKNSNAATALQLLPKFLISKVEKKLREFIFYGISPLFTAFYVNEMFESILQKGISQD